MKKIVFVFLLLIPFVVSAFAQATVTLDRGISECVERLENRIPRRSRIAVINIRSAFPNLSEYIMEELIDQLINSGLFSVVDRANLQLVRDELNFNLSGEVSDETAQSIGRFLGAQTIISGSVDQAGDMFRMRVRAIVVETGAFQASHSVNIQRDRFVNSLAVNDTQSQQSGSVPSSTSSPSSSSGQGNRTMLPDYLLN